MSRSWPDVKAEDGQAPEARRVDWIRVLGNVACSSSHTTPTTLPPSLSTMAKPTLVQSLLGRPSQTYHFPSSKDYHSTKSDFLRAAAAEDPSPSESRPQSYFTAADSESGYYSSTSSASRYSEARSHSEASSRRSSRLDGEPEVSS